MRTASVIVLLGIVAFVAALVWRAHGGAEVAAALPVDSPSTGVSSPPRADVPASQITAADSVATDVAADPRLAALQPSPEGSPVEFVRAPDGTLLAEIGNQPGTPDFRKRTREYVYTSGRIVGLTTYRHSVGHVEIGTHVVSYRPDGSVDRVERSTVVREAK